MGQKKQLQVQPGLAVIASHPGIVAPAAGVRKAPGLPPPGRCRARGQGASAQVRRWRRAGGTGFQGAGGAKGKLTGAQAAELEEAPAREGFLAKPSVAFARAAGAEGRDGHAEMREGSKNGRPSGSLLDDLLAGTRQGAVRFH